MKWLFGGVLALAALGAPAAANAEESLEGRFSPAMVTTGTVMAVAGSFGLLVSVPLTISAYTCDHDCTRREIWPAALASGFAVTASIPLLVIGMQPAPKDEVSAAGAARVLFRAAPNEVGLFGVF